MAIRGENAPKGMAFGLLAKFDLGAKESSDETMDESTTEEQKPKKKKKHKKQKKTESEAGAYGPEADVVRVSERLNMVKINKGDAEGIQKGQTFDLFEAGSEEPVAKAKVVRVKADSAILRINKFYKEVRIQKGFVAKQPVQ